MKVALSLTLALALVTGSQARSMHGHRVRAVPMNESIDGKIINGTPAELGQFPHLAHVHFYRGTSGYVCSGSMLAPNWVITAGHCVEDVDRFIITVGALNWREPEEGAVVSETTRSILHEMYDQPFGLNHDIGLIELTENIETTDNIAISEISKEIFGADVPVIVAGWGKTSDSGSASNILMYNDGGVFTVSNEKCIETFGPLTVTDAHICTTAGPEGGTCNGDSGSPLNYREEDGRLVTIGLCSFGSSAGCEAVGYPKGFTRISSYIDWIEENSGVTL